MSDDNIALKRQLEGLNRLHQLQRLLREAESQAQAGFIMVNETRQLVTYRQAAWWQPTRGVTHASGLTDVERNAPYVRWCNRVCETLSRTAVHAFSASDLPEALAAEWGSFLPPFALSVPVFDSASDSLAGILLLARDKAWQPHEIGLLEELAAIYLFALRALRAGHGTRITRWKNKRLLAVAVALMAAACLIPVRLNVLAPAEVVAQEAQPVRAPYEGVVDTIHVQPNQPVRAGDLLLSLDSADLKNRLQIAKQTLQIARTEFRQVAQQAVFDEKGKLEVAIRRGMAEKSLAEVQYLESLLSRTEVRASVDGIAVLTDPAEWTGRPVALGERIMTLADPARAELRLEMPIRDAIPLKTGADVQFFMNIAPDTPLQASLAWLAFQAAETEERQLAYTGRAHFPVTQPPPRIGLRGTAKLYGERAPLIYYLLRKPLAALRQWAGV